MYFFTKKQKWYLDLRGDLILTHNPTPVAANRYSATPQIHGGQFIIVPKANLFRATWVALCFIWGPEYPADHGTVKEPVRKAVNNE